MFKRILIASIFVLGMSSQAKATAPCLNFIKTVDWRFFADELEFEFKACRCKLGDLEASTKAGFKMSLSEPIAALEATNDPWSFPCLDIGLDTRVDRSHGSSQDGGDNSNGFKYYHFIIFPIFAVLNYNQDTICFERVNLINLGVMSELLPQSKNDILANMTDLGVNLLTANPIAQASCVADCAMSTAGNPANSMFWCSGCWEPPKTDSSFIAGRAPVAESASLVQKMLRFMHRTAMLTKTSNASFAFTTEEAGSVQSSMCEERLFFERIKSQYQLNLNGPTVGSAFVTGEYPMLFSRFKNKITSKDAFSFWLWRKRDFCAGAYKCRSTFAGASSGG